MPTLRWLGPKSVTSRSAILMLPPVGPSNPATMRSTVVLPHPDGPSSETNSPRTTERSTRWTATFWPKALWSFSISRKAMIVLGAGGAAGAAEDLNQAHAGPGDEKGDDGEGGRLIGPVRADQLEVGAEGRAVEEARQGELADDDREGEECATEERRPDVRQDDPEEDGR